MKQKIEHEALLPFIKYVFIILVGTSSIAIAQERQETFFREDFKENCAEIPIKQDRIVNSDLVFFIRPSISSDKEKSLRQACQSFILQMDKIM